MKVVKYSLSWLFILQVMLIAFFTLQPVAFFAHPDPIFLSIFMFLLILLFLANLNKRVASDSLGNAVLPLFWHLPSFLFGVAIILSSIVHIILYGDTNFWILYGSIMFIFYCWAFHFLFPKVNDLYNIVRFFGFTLIFLSLVAMVLELFQLMVLGLGHESILNKASSHYRTTFSQDNLLLDYRPLGLTGNYTINSCLIILGGQFLLLINDNMGKLTNNIKEYLVLIFVSFGVIIAQSGTGYVLLSLFLVLYLFEKIKFNLDIKLLLFTFIGISFFLIFMGEIFDIYRLTMGYYFHNYFIFIEDLKYFVEMDLSQVLFGTPPELGLGHIDTGPSIALMRLGLFGFIPFLLFYGYLYHTSLGREKIFVFLFIIASLRYPVIWNQIGQLMLALFILWRSSIRKTDIHSQPAILKLEKLCSTRS